MIAAHALQAQTNVIRKLTSLARRLRTPRTTLGYSAFLLFALEYECQPIIWEGETPVQIIHEYAEWAKPRCLKECKCDAVALSLIHISEPTRPERLSESGMN